MFRGRMRKEISAGTHLLYPLLLFIRSGTHILVIASFRVGLASSVTSFWKCLLDMSRVVSPR